MVPRRAGKCVLLLQLRFQLTVFRIEPFPYLDSFRVAACVHSIPWLRSYHHVFGQVLESAATEAKSCCIVRYKKAFQDYIVNIERITLPDCISYRTRASLYIRIVVVVQIVVVVRSIATVFSNALKKESVCRVAFSSNSFFLR